MNHSFCSFLPNLPIFCFTFLEFCTGQIGPPTQCQREGMAAGTRFFLISKGNLSVLLFSGWLLQAFCRYPFIRFLVLFLVVLISCIFLEIYVVRTCKIIATLRAKKEVCVRCVASTPPLDLPDGFTEHSRHYRSAKQSLTFLTSTTSGAKTRFTFSVLICALFLVNFA